MNATRRGFFLRLASGLFVSAMSADAFADALQTTPWATEGPFYPYNKLPLDKDNDLVIVNKSLTQAVGTVTNLSGKILDTNGNPVKNALVEIWQCDANGVYLAQSEQQNTDKNFQGYGRFETDSTGAYRFRTIKPVIYPGRCPHIHVKISTKGKASLTTQLFIKGHPNNARDGVFGQLGGAKMQALVAKDFTPVKGSKIGELAVSFDIILGATPIEGERGGFGPGGPPGPPPDGFGPGGPPPGGFGRPRRPRN
jgi:protocatechuate 3,4-dioxygenase, beta subunit